MFSKKNIFISHSSQNKEIAEQICAFLTRFGIGEEKIFCSSIIGQGVGNGEKLNDAIGKAINKSKLLIYLLSNDFLNSSYCMEELGIGWYLANKNRATCFYLVLPDIDLSELKGFINSKIDKFSFVDSDHKEDLGLFAIDVAKKLRLKTPTHQIILNASKTFFSASEAELIKIKEIRDSLKKNDECKKKEHQDLKNKLKEKCEIIDKLEKKCSSLLVGQERKLMYKEYQTIIECYHILGTLGGISKAEYEAMNKSFWSIIINKFEELEKEFGIQDYHMQMLLANIYSANGYLDKAYERLKLFFELNDSNIYPSYLINVKLDNKNDAQELIDILKEKLTSEAFGVVYDSYKETLDYLEKRKQNLSMAIREIYDKLPT